MAISRIMSAVKIQGSAEIRVFIPMYVRLSERQLRVPFTTLFSFDDGSIILMALVGHWISHARHKWQF